VYEHDDGLRACDRGRIAVRRLRLHGRDLQHARAIREDADRMRAHRRTIAAVVDVAARCGLGAALQAV